MKVTKSSSGVPRLSYTGRDDRHFLPTGLYIIKTVSGTSLTHVSLFCCCVKHAFKYERLCALPSEPWTMAYSKKSMKKFFFNKLTKQSTYDMPPNAAAPFQYVPSSPAVASHLCLCAGVTFLLLLRSQCLPL